MKMQNPDSFIELCPVQNNEQRYCSICAAGSNKLDYVFQSYPQPGWGSASDNGMRPSPCYGITTIVERTAPVKCAAVTLLGEYRSWVDRIVVLL